MAHFKKLQLKQFPELTERETAEARFWRSFSRPVEDIHPAPPVQIHFNPANPRQFCVTSSVRLTLYDAVTNKVQRTFSRFGANAFSGTFRSDGKLLCAGDGNGVVKVVDQSTRLLMKDFKGHSQAVHCTKWSNDNTRVISGGDDKKIIWWDLSTEQAITTYKHAHTDYVRALTPIPGSDSLVLSGGYDHCVRLWDIRQPHRSSSSSSAGAGEGASSSSGAVWSLQLSSPIEQLLPLASGTMVLSASGNTITVHDLAAGGRAVHSYSGHQKNISSMCLDGTNTRVISASLGGHIRVNTVGSYEQVYGTKLAAPVTSVGMSGDNKKLVVGLTDGVLAIRTRMDKKSIYDEDDDEETDGDKAKKRKRRAPADIRELVAETDAAIAEMAATRHYKGTSASSSSSSSGGAGAGGIAGDDYRVESVRRIHLKVYERALKRFRYGEALDSALETRNPIIVMTVLDELAARQGLGIALAGRDESTLEPLLSFLSRYLTHPRYCRLLTEVSHRVCDVYGDVIGESESVDELVHKLARDVRQELSEQKKLMKVLASLDCVLASSSATSAGAASSSAAGSLTSPSSSSLSSLSSSQPQLKRVKVNGEEGAPGVNDDDAGVAE